jgi:hypothetical protein
MTSDWPLPGPGELPADPLPAPAQAPSAAGTGEAADGGDPACWACLVCGECGAVVSEGHRAGCSRSSFPAGPLQASASRWSVPASTGYHRTVSTRCTGGPDRA